MCAGPEHSEEAPVQPPGTTVHTGALVQQGGGDLGMSWVRAKHEAELRVESLYCFTHSHPKRCLHLFLTALWARLG